MNIKGENIIHYAVEVPKSFPSKQAFFSINIDENHLLDYILTIFFILPFPTVLFCFIIVILRSK